MGEPWRVLQQQLRQRGQGAAPPSGSVPGMHLPPVLVQLQLRREGGHAPLADLMLTLVVIRPATRLEAVFNGQLQLSGEGRERNYSSSMQRQQG